MHGAPTRQFQNKGIKKNKMVDCLLRVEGRDAHFPSWGIWPNKEEAERIKSRKQAPSIGPLKVEEGTV